MFPGMPELASLKGGSIDSLMLYIHLLMVAIFVPWTIFFFYCVFRFRKSKNPKADHRGAGGKISKYAEVSVALVEAILLVGISIPFWMTEMDLEAKQIEDADVRVKVLAQQFVWNIHYPGPDGIFGNTDPSFIDTVANPVGIDPEDPYGEDDIVTINDMRIPVGKTVVVEATAKDVIHNFYLPQMRVKRDVIPGQNAEILFTPTKKGEWQIACAQLCGNGHYRMAGAYSVVSEEDYQSWLDEFSQEVSAEDAFDAFEDEGGDEIEF
jgi:cytochrome c oxidase subunit 2